MNEYNAVVLLGPTAVGKTSLGVSIADRYGWDIISADSRQVYKGLDLGSGKDIEDYTLGNRTIPYHLIDVTTLDEEYNVFKYQSDFYKNKTEERSVYEKKQIKKVRRAYRKKRR